MDILDLFVLKVVVEYNGVSCVVEVLYCVLLNIIVCIKKLESELGINLFFCENN